MGNSYVLHLSKLGIGSVTDMAFLHGYAEPVLLVLHETQPSWVGRCGKWVVTSWSGVFHVVG